MEKDTTDARTRTVFSTWYLGAAQLVGTGASYLLLAALTRLGPDTYGLWVLALNPQPFDPGPLALGFWSLALALGSEPLPLALNPGLMARGPWRPNC